MVRAKQTDGKTAIRKAEKRAKQAEKANRKALKQADCDEVPIETLLATMQNDAGSNSGSLQVCEPMSARSSCTFESLGKGSSFALFGGEYFDSKTCKVFNDTYKWSPGKEVEWRKLINGVLPKPRVGHASAVLGEDIYIHGGEFSTISQFHHFRDLWKLNTKQFKWEEIQAKGDLPTARSGHRMVSFRSVLILFGGFHESARESRYYNDIYLFQPSTCRWTKLKAKAGAHVPTPRSGVALASNDEGIFISGGYSKNKDTDRSVQGMVHNDVWFVNLKDVVDEGGENAIITFQKMPARSFSPNRSGMGTTTSKNTLYAFGGVTDIDEGGFAIKNSLFFNDVLAFDLKKGRWSKASKTGEPSSVFFIADKKLMRAKLDPTKKTAHANSIEDILDMSSVQVVSPDSSGSEPLPRLNASICVRSHALYLTGGTLEIGSKNLVFDDSWKYDIKSGSWELIYEGTCCKYESVSGLIVDSDSDESASGSDVESDREDEDDSSSEYSSDSTGSTL